MIRRLLPVIAMLSVFGVGLASPSGRPPHVAEAERLLESVGHAIASEYDVALIGTGGELMRNIRTINLSFQASRPLSKDDARRFLVGAAQVAVNQMNDAESARAYLETYPATVRSIRISIFSDHDTYEPYIVSARLSRGRVSYLFQRDAEDLACEHRERETFEEAQAIVNAE